MFKKLFHRCKSDVSMKLATHLMFIDKTILSPRRIHWCDGQERSICYAWVRSRNAYILDGKSKGRQLRDPGEEERIILR
jgi:hypothetical protein